MALAAALVTARTTRVGPSIALAPGNGVHLGDLASLLCWAVGASAVTWTLRGHARASCMEILELLRSGSDRPPRR